jgi:LytS/YehU family sensor histidine kinase
MGMLIGSILIFALLGIILFRNFSLKKNNALLQNKREQAELQQQAAELKMQTLRTQMNPHFIFNSLNSIKGMILDNEQHKASRYLTRFAQMIRITLNQSKEVFTTLYENLEHLESYLLMEKLRFDDSFTFQITVDECIDREETLIVECDPRRIEEVRRNWPFLRDRRIDAYGGITSRVLD